MNPYSKFVCCIAAASFVAAFAKSFIPEHFVYFLLGAYCGGQLESFGQHIWRLPPTGRYDQLA